MLVFVLTMISTFFLIVAIGIIVPTIRERSKSRVATPEINKVALIFDVYAFAAELVAAKVAESRGSSLLVIDDSDNFFVKNEGDDFTVDMNVPKISNEFRPELTGRPEVATYVLSA